MLQYAMIQTYENADRRTHQRQTLYQKLFETAAGSPERNECELESIRELFLKELTQQKPEVIEMLLKVLADSTKHHKQGADLADGVILKAAYQDVM